MNKLRLFAGVGGPGGKGQQRPDKNLLLANQRHLYRIRKVLIKYRIGTFTPHVVNVLGFAGLAFGLVPGFAWVVGSFGVTYNPLVVLALAIASGIATGVYVNRHSKAPRTHMDHLDRLLAAYEPVSKDAYRELQEKVKGRGAMDDGLVEEWLELENYALQSAAGGGLPSEIHFLKKKV